MRLLKTCVIATFCVLTMTVRAATGSYDLAQRMELKRTDLSGAPGMEVVTSVSEFRKGEGIPVHSHHGIETGYVAGNHGAACGQGTDHDGDRNADP
jgi:hypothetical protein